MDVSSAVHTLERDLRGIFGARLRSLIVYGLRARRQAEPQRDHHGSQAHTHEMPPTHTLVVVDALTPDDLRACSTRVGSWHDAALATPLVVATHEFERSLDTFPFEFGDILTDHVVVSGANPFDGLRVDTADLRRACEVQARGHLLHLREGYIETRGRADALAVLIVQSAPAFATLITSVARLDGRSGDDAAAVARHVERRLELSGTTAGDVTALAGVKEISSAEAERLFAPYLDTVERLVRYVDGWKARDSR